MSNSNSIPSYQESLQDLLKQLAEMLPAEQLAVFNKDAAALGKAYQNPLNLNIGDQAPDFTLPNAIGKEVQLRDLLKSGPVVLTFYRGTWCPYCNLQLRQLEQVLPQLKAKGGQLVAISPQTPDHSLDMKQKNELSFEVLSDSGNKVAQAFTTVFRYSDSSLKAMSDLGYDFFSFYSDDSGELPIPATFVIDQKGMVVFAQAEGGDYRNRVEPQAILDALKGGNW